MREAERALRAAFQTGDPVAFVRARDVVRAICVRGGLDPRVNPREGDAVRGGKVCAASTRVVARVCESPLGGDVVRVERELVVDMLGRAGFGVSGLDESGAFYVHAELQRGVFLPFPENHHYGWRVIDAAARVAERTERAPLVVLAEELDVRGPWIEWVGALDLDAFGIARRGSGARWKSRDRVRSKGRCSLSSWRAWARKGEVLRLAEEVA